MTTTENLDEKLYRLRRRVMRGESITPEEQHLLTHNPPDPPPPRATPVATKTKTVKVKGGNPEKTSVNRHRPAPRPAKPTKLQRKAAASIDNADHEPKRKSKGGGGKKKSLASRAKNKIGRKHKILRPVVYLLVGLGVGGAKTGKWVAIGTGKAGKWSGKRIASKIRADAHKRKWVPEATRPGGMSRFSRFTQLSCACGKTYASIEALNAHLVKKHQGEERQYTKTRPKIQRGHSRRTAGKVIVRPEVAGGGRHRARHNLPSFRSVDAVIAAHRDHFTKIGDAVMTAENAAASLKRAAREFADSPVPKTLAELTQQCVGMERAMASLGDAIGDYGQMLARRVDVGDRRGGNIDPALVRVFVNAAQEHAGALGRDFTRFIVAFHDFYHDEITAARRKTKPNMDLSKTG